MITRQELEQWRSINAAGELARLFFDDHQTYPDHEFYSRRRGSFKDIPEELWPIYLVAKHLPEAVEMRLSPSSIAGPDGEIRFGHGATLTVQVTSSLERDGGHLRRMELRDTGLYMTPVRSTATVVEERLSRILDAVVAKEECYRDGTDVLVIREQSISWGRDLAPRLKVALANAVSDLKPSHYSATYVVFNQEVYQLR